MTYGKETCKILKEIRQQIADKNDIEYATSECHYHGECKGTCPKCEAELQYLETELSKRRQLGKAVAVAGISLGLASTFTNCNTLKQNTPQQENMPVVEEQILKEQLKLPNITDTTSAIPPRHRISTTGIIMDGQDNPNPIWDDTTKRNDLDIFEGLIVNTTKCNNGERIYDFVEINPEFPGGMDSLYAFLQENIKYPQAAHDARIEGTTIIRFVINKDGTVGNVTVLRGSSYYILDKEAVRVVKSMPNWIPGKINGKPVALYYKLPIKFQIED
jgi:TonB family protein